MGFLDEAKDAAEKLISEHPEQAGQALDKVEGLVDQQTGGKFTDQIDQGGDKLGEALGIPETPAN